MLTVMETFGPFLLEERLDSGGEFEFFRASRAATPYRDNAESCVVLRAPADAWAPWASPAIATRLRHPSIVAMLDSGTIGDQMWFAYEHAGLDLRRFLLDGPLPTNAAIEVTRHVVDALAAAHALSLDGKECSVLHSALAPRCVFVSREGVVKLSGFVTGRIKPESPPMEFDRSMADQIEARLNAAPQWAPEQLRGEESTRQSDAFLVGALLHSMLFGVDYVSKTMAAMRATKRSTTLSHDDPHSPVLRRLLAERPDERFQSMDDVRQALDALSPREESNDPLLARTWLAARAADLLQRD